MFPDTHKQACDWFEQHALEWLDWRNRGLGRSKKLIAIVPRDWGKTTLFTQAGQAWLHVHDRNLATYTGGESLQRAKEVLAGIKAVISGDDHFARFTELYGSWFNRERRWKAEEIVTSVRTNLARRDASFGTWGVGTGLVGLHPDGCFFDDPNTYERMERDSEWLLQVNKHQDTLIPVFQSDAFWMLTGTRYGDGDNLGKTIKHEGIASITGMPMDGVKVDPNGEWHLFFMDAFDERICTWDPHDINPAGLTMPRIWSKSRCKQLLNRNPERFYAQVRNNPSSSITNPLTRAQAESLIIPADDFNPKGKWISLHSDCSLRDPTKMARGDSTVIEAWMHDRKGTGMVTFIDSRFSTEWNTEKYLTNLCEMVGDWRKRGAKVFCMTDEREPGGKSEAWAGVLKNAFAQRGMIMPTYVEIPRGGMAAAKHKRIIAAAANWAQGKARLLRTAPGLDSIIEQMTRKTEYDDFADCGADVFHGEVYQAMLRMSQTGDQKHEAMPFDEILKTKGELAAVHDHVESYWKNEAQMIGQYDTVCP